MKINVFCSQRGNISPAYWPLIVNYWTSIMK